MAFLVHGGDGAGPDLQCGGDEHPWLAATYRDATALRERLTEALSEGPWLVGDRYPAADLHCVSPFLWFRDLDPGEPQVADWVARDVAHPAVAQVQAWDAKLLAT